MKSSNLTIAVSGAALAVLISFARGNIVAQTSASKSGKPATLQVMGDGKGTGSEKGFRAYFVITRAGSVVEEKGLLNEMLGISFSLPAGDYELLSYQRRCLENCRDLGPPQRECIAVFSIAAGKTLYAVRSELLETKDIPCRLTISSSRPKPGILERTYPPGKTPTVIIRN